jgi:starch synthase
VPSALPVRGSLHEKLLDTLFRDIMMVSLAQEPDLVHCHTWYTHLAGCLIKELHGCPLVLTTHSLEPQRPWKEEQLGAGYAVSVWLEKTAFQNADGVIAVSQPMKQAVKDLYGVPSDKVRVIPNGIDMDAYRPTPDPELLTSYRIDPSKPYVLFVGRITRQKGIIHLVNAIKHLAPGIQVVLCAGAPDSPEIGRQMAESVDAARSQTKNEIVWIRQWIPREKIVTLYTHASVFVCPSVYEPFGIVNLEAMACGTPVVASAVGGIPDVVIPGETGLLVPFETVSKNDWEPKNPEQFSIELAAAVNSLFDSANRLTAMSKRCRQLVEERFSWSSVARDTLRFYRELKDEFEQKKKDLS